MRLNKIQIDLIRGDIRQSGVEMRDLEDDILDHICCAIEHHPESPLPFEDIYREVKEEIFPSGLKKIQHKTAHLLSLKFSKMKKTMNILGVTGSVMLLVGSLLKIVRLPGAGALIGIGTLTLIFGYLATMMILALRNTDLIVGKLRAISGFLGASLIVLGLTLRILHWPSGLVLLGGFLVLTVIFLPLYLKSVSGEKDFRIGTSSAAILVLIIVTMFFSTSAIRVPSQFTKALAEITNDMNSTYSYQYQRLASQRSQDAMSLETQELLSYIEDMKEYMLGSVNPQNNNEEFSQYQVMEFSPVTDQIMLGDPRQPFDGKVLNQKLDSWKASLSSRNPEIAANSVADFNPEEMVNKPLYHIYMKLSKMQLDIVTAELESSARS